MAHGGRGDPGTGACSLVKHAANRLFLKNNVDTTKTTTHVSLCAGYGGIDLGLSRAIPNLRTIAFSEIEAFACANLVAKMEAGLLDPAPIWTNLKTFPWSEFRDRVDILSGGYPCQPFSAAGKRLGKDDPRHLWPWIADGIVSMRPRICFFENVEGHISLGLREVISELEGLGYQTTWGVFSAREVGAPHQRKRVFILAYRNNEGSQRAICEGIQRASRKSFGHNDDVLANSNNGRGWEDKLLPELRTTGVEQSSRCSRLPSESTQVGEITVWPSRPGQPQHGWEPPRVVVDAKSQRARQRSELRSEECGSGSALPWDVEQSDQVVGNAILHGHATSEIGRGTSQSEAEGRLQESERGSSSVGDSEHDGSLGLQECRGSHQDCNRSEEGTINAVEFEGAGRSADCGHLPENKGGFVGDSTEQRCKGSRGQDDSGRSIFRSSESDGSSSDRSMESGQWQTQPTLGGDSDGASDWLGYAELFVTSDNRTDELRLLGNGVVPATATRAFLVLMDQLLNQ